MYEAELDNVDKSSEMNEQESQETTVYYLCYFTSDEVEKILDELIKIIQMFVWGI